MSMMLEARFQELNNIEMQLRTNIQRVSQQLEELKRNYTECVGGIKLVSQIMADEKKDKEVEKVKDVTGNWCQLK